MVVRRVLLAGRLDHALPLEVEEHGLEPLPAARAVAAPQIDRHAGGWTEITEALGGWRVIGRVRLVTTSGSPQELVVLVRQPLDEQLHLGPGVREGHLLGGQLVVRVPRTRTRTPCCT